MHEYETIEAKLSSQQKHVRTRLKEIGILFFPKLASDYLVASSTYQECLYPSTELSNVDVFNCVLAASYISLTGYAVYKAACYTKQVLSD